MTLCHQPKTEVALPDCTVVKLDGSPASVEYLFNFFCDPRIQAIQPDGHKGYVPINNGVEELKSGRLHCFVPVVDGTPVGMVFGRLISGELGCFHWGVFLPKQDLPENATREDRWAARYKRKAIHGLLRNIVLDRMWSDLGISAIMGLIPVLNRPSYAAAYEVGFRPQGKIPNHYLLNGVRQDVHIMILNKEDS